MKKKKIKHLFGLLESQIDPECAVAEFSLLPRDLVQATEMLLPLPTPSDNNNNNAWGLLPERNRHQFRVVYYYYVVKKVGKPLGRYSPHDLLKRAVVAWLRYTAVVQAKSEGFLWEEVFDIASDRLRNTVAKVGPSGMKKIYCKVNPLQSAHPFRD